MVAKKKTSKKIQFLGTGRIKKAIDRVRLTGENSSRQNLIINHIFIKEPDDALALLLRTTLELQGYDIVENLNVEEAAQPAILIIDSGDNLEELDFCKKIKCNPNFVNSKIIVTTSVHDKAAVLDAGVDLYLPKPYEITDLIQWIEYFMKNII